MHRRTVLRGGVAVAGGLALAGQAVTASWAGGTGTPVTLVGDTSSGGIYFPYGAGLTRTPFLKLPAGSIRATGWLSQQLSLDASGIAGNYDQVSHFLVYADSGWVNPAKGGWEELPYWLRGLTALAAVTGDAALRSKVSTWVNGIVATVQPDGFFGPTALRTSLGGGPDFWPFMPLLQALRTYQEYSGDTRIVPMLTKFLQYQNQFGASAFNQSWGSVRWATNLDTVFWLFARTGQSFLLSLADKIHQYSKNYVNNLPSMHNVDLAQGFTEPALMALRGNTSLTQATYNNYSTIQSQWGQFPGGGFAGDENIRTDQRDPRQGFETCGIVEYMQSFETLTRLTGDPSWADGCENLAFNSLPASMEPNHRSLHYITSANSVQLDNRAKTQGQYQNGFAMQAYLLGVDQYRCCPHNYGQGWSYFTDNLVQATADRGLAVTMYAPSTTTAKVGAGAATVTLTQETSYPFNGAVTLRLATSGAVAFPLYARIPSWCPNPSLTVNGAAQPVVAGPAYVAVNRTWNNGDTVVLTLPMSPKTTTWTANQNAISVSNGPLTYSLEIGQNFLRYNDPNSAWPEWQVFPTSAWNYGLVPGTFAAVAGGGSGNPFTPAGTPVALTAQARPIPNWQADSENVVSRLQLSPVASSEPIKTVRLIPMGAASLRITSFPVIGGSRQWQLPATPSASWTFSGDTVTALNSYYDPASSYDQSHRRFTWWDHTGTSEWVQYTYVAPVSASSVSVYWYDDTDHGQCRVPASWRLEYLNSSGAWQAVSGASGYGTALNTYNTTTFTAVTTTALRIVAQLKAGFSGGVLQWNVTATPAITRPNTWYRVQNANSGKVLGVAGMSTADSANVVQFADNGSADHNWRFDHVGNGWYLIVNQNSGKVLAVGGMSRANSALVQQFADNGSADHYWQLLGDGGGWLRIRNLNSGLVLGVSGMSTADSAQVVQYEDNGTADHRWRLLG
ncbi:beta-L-arabinofuranosidase domain-containing protein [Catellatospora tritici]|uniref:beta-L-arabinofuranosidase domain-containing protein n=1 Tax=Catellatospora tritici TaxID=2851566 RepID=UPI001C2D7150|nr:beta-L-arabinofuranosidase domain-containing protein [Catellatospora tritici]MBV1853735.1 glycoside hydrolase family 127 protein [Catellatospora tritici]